MSTISRYCIILLIITTTFSQTGSISNIDAAQRTDGSQIVDIYYDLEGSEETYGILLEVSFDDGNTLIPIFNHYGDSHMNVAPGNNKHIIWSFGSEFPNMFNDDTRIKLTATNLGWVTIPAGPYTYGEADETQNIDYDFHIMQYEVNHNQYRAYLEVALEAGVITVTETSVLGYYPGDENITAGDQEFLDLDNANCRIDYIDGEFLIVQGYEHHPVTVVSWFGAWAFADFFGWELPTEQEWEKAARGNTGWDYPWGDNISGTQANYRDSGDPFDNGTTPVGYYDGSNQNGYQTQDSPSVFGAYDMGGNVWEWCDSWGNSSSRVMRGGSWNGGTTNLSSWYRYLIYPSGMGSAIGFRCSRTP